MVSRAYNANYYKKFKHHEAFATLQDNFIIFQKDKHFNQFP